MRGVKAGDRAAKVDRILERVHLSDMGGRLPSQRSGDQQQRVAPARALIAEPPIRSTHAAPAASRPNGFSAQIGASGDRPSNPVRSANHPRLRRNLARHHSGLALPIGY